MRRTLSAIGCLGLTVLFAACITVNIYFPAPEVRAAAEEIVEETWGGPAQGPAQTEPAQGPQGWLWRALPSAGVAWAGEASPNIEVSTAAIRKLKAAMKARAAELKPALARGNVGIAKDGMLAIKDVAGLNLRDQAKLRRLIDAENRDRRSLYAEIAKANDFGDDRIDDIAAIFAETWIAKAEAGWWVQSADGSWKRR